MPDAVIVETVRTPIGTAFKGTLTETTPEEMAIHVLKHTVERSGIDPSKVDDVIFAQSNGAALSRYAAVALGYDGVAGQSVNRYCAGGLTATATAAGSIIAGMDRAVVAGGVHTSSLAHQVSRRLAGTTDEVESSSPTFPYHGDVTDDVTLTVGWNVAQKCGISRQQMDEWAVRSHHRAIAAIDAGHFDHEIVPIRVKNKSGEEVDFAVDEHPRRGSTLEKVGSLKPLHPEIDGFSITAGNASGVNDAAGALLVTSDEFAREEGLQPLARIRSWGAAGVAPRVTGLGALDASERALARAGLRPADIHLWEINEAFASVPVAVCQELGLDEDLVNLSGSGCSLGHPISMTGARMIMTLVHDLRRRGGGIGLAGMCAAGGQGGAMVVEVG